METFNRICIKDYEIKDDYGNSARVERGKEYITSAVNSAPQLGPKPQRGYVIVFANFWFSVPIEHFAGEQKCT